MLSLNSLHTLESITVVDGVADLSHVDFKTTESIPLSGDWEFYWDQLLQSSDFQKKEIFDKKTAKVPGAWSVGENGGIPSQGVATYHLMIVYPKTLKDPAIRIQNVSTAYKVYANGQLLADVGNITKKASDFINEEKLSILALPSNAETIELIIQVGN